MINNIGLNKMLWSVVSVLAFVASLVGVVDPGIYTKVVSKEIIPGAYSQDLQSLVAAVFLLVLTVITKEKDVKKQVVIFGLLGYFFYAYGIYVIERAYNLYYLLYMGIFSLSFWVMLFGLVSINKDVLQKVTLSKKIRMFSAIGAFLQPIIFYPLWVSALIPLMQTGNQIDNLYSIYIIDLCFIMPAFAILAYYTFRNKGVGLVLLPAMFILGFTLIFSLAVGEVVKPLFQMTANTDGLFQSLGLSLFFLLLGIIHLWKLKIAK